MGWMDKTPEIVFKRIGKKAPRKIIKAADFIPIPNHKIAMGIQARGGIGLISSKRGRTILRSLEDHPIKSPKGIANKAAIA
jgi:predicted transcriptional regulator